MTAHQQSREDTCSKSESDLAVQNTYQGRPACGDILDTEICPRCTRTPDFAFPTLVERPFRAEHMCHDCTLLAKTEPIDLEDNGNQYTSDRAARVFVRLRLCLESYLETFRKVCMPKRSQQTRPLSKVSTITSTTSIPR